LDRGEALKAYLKLKEFTYTDFANKLGCSAASVCLWVNGKKCPGRAMAIKIQKVTKSAVPITSWGYVIGKYGKLMRI
jgi:transcriptional regulator with XRE-family HTH domain